MNGQLSCDFSYSYFYDNNPLRAATGEKELVHSIKTDLSYQLFDRELYLSYDGNFNIFQKESDRNYQQHSVGLNSGFKIGEVEEENFYTGIDLSLKKGISDYKIYDFNQLLFFVNGRFAIGNMLFLQPSYNLSYKYFSALNALTHFENLFTFQISKFFDSGTGIFVEAELGSKYYSFNDKTAIIRYNPHPLMGRKPFDTVGFRTTKVDDNVVQLRYMLKVSQSLFENTGVNAYYTGKTNLNEAKYLSQNGNYIYSGDDELWDDPYAYSSNEFGAGLTQKLPFDITFKLSGQFSNRHYSNNLADTLNINQRIDNRFEISGSLSKTITELPILNSLNISLYYIYVNNKSGASAFTYKNNMALVGLLFSL